MDNLINLKLSIDGKEANATINLTDANIKELYKSFKYGQAEVNGFTTAISRGMNNAREIIGGVKESFSVLQSLFSTPVQAAAQFESFRVQFEVLLGSADEAQSRIEELSEFAAKTPFQLPEVVDASRQLEVLTKGALSTGDGLTMVGDVAAGTGVKINELAMWFGRLYDNIQSGRPIGEALMRLQELGAISGETRGELEKLQSSNELQAQGWEVVTQAMERFSGMMEKESETLGGKLSNLEDNFGKVQVAIGGVIAIGLSPMLDVMNNMITTIYEFSPELVGFAGTIGLLTASFTMLKIAGLGPVIVELMTMKISFLGTATGANVLSFSIAGATTAVKTFFASLGPIGWFVIGISALATAFAIFSDNSDRANESAEAFKSVINQMGVDELKQDLVVTNQRLNEMRELLMQLYSEGASTKEKTDLTKRIVDLEEKRNNVVAEIEKREKSIAEQKERQYKSLREQMDIDVLESDQKAAIEREKKRYEKDKSVLSERHYQLTTAEKLAHKDFIDLERIHQQNIKEIKKKYRDEERERQFEKQSDELKISGEHEVKLAEIYGDSADKIFLLKEKNLILQIELHKKFNKSSVELEHELTELRAEEELRRNKNSELSHQKRIEEHFNNNPQNQNPDEYIDPAEFSRMQIENIDNEFERKKALNDWEREQEYEKYKNYKDFSQIKTQLDAKHALNKKRIEEGSMQESLRMMGTLLAEQSFLGKAMAIANAYINTYEGASKAIAMGPWGIPLIPLIVGAGMEQVANIMSVQIPKLATGGVVTRPTTALIGEAGPEAIIPLSRYNLSASGINTYKLETLIENHIKSVEDSITRVEFKIKSNDLYGALKKENNRRRGFK